MRKIIVGLVLNILFWGILFANPTPQQDLNILYIKLQAGTVVIKLRPDLAPKHVARIKELVKEGFYNGLPFQRVIDGFMAQTGDPTGTGQGGSGQSLKAEFSSTPFVRGTVGMARASSPNSADSQFFIVTGDASHLNGQYTVWGQVISGMEYVDGLKKGDDMTGTVVAPDRIITATLGEMDVKIKKSKHKTKS